MELLNQDEIIYITKQCGYSKMLKWTFEELPDKILGFLGEHLNLFIEVESDGIVSTLKLFVKCLPRFDLLKAQYLKELTFFKKEYAMLGMLFKEFVNRQDSHKGRPKLLFLKEDIFVFENVKLQGYEMPHQQKTLTYEELSAVIVTLARFHAQSYIFEERKSKELGRPYRIWEDYSEYLQEPYSGQSWRDTGRNAVIEFLKVFSKYRSEPNFNRDIETIIPGLYDRALELMKPSSDHRNAVVHRDLWTNNLFLKKNGNSSYHVLFIDFQTVLYCSPMVDLSSMIYFNTSRASRSSWTEKLIDFYYTVLSKELKATGVKIDHIVDKNTMHEAYEQSIVFAMTQAGLITPILAMSKEKREEMFSDPEKTKILNEVSRSEEFIHIANEDDKYRVRITDLLDEIVERFVLPKDNVVHLPLV